MGVHRGHAGAARRLAGEAAARVHRRHGLARGRLRQERGLRATAITATRCCRAFRSSRTRTRTSRRTRSRAAACCTARSSSGAGEPDAALHQRPPRAVRARPAVADPRAVRAHPRRRCPTDAPLIIAGDFNDWRHKANRLLRRGARRRRGVRGGARAAGAHVPVGDAGVPARPHLRARPVDRRRARALRVSVGRGCPTTRRSAPRSRPRAAARDEPVPAGQPRHAAAQRRRVLSGAGRRDRRAREREVWLETYIFADDDVGRHRRGGARPRGAARRHRARAGRRLGREALPHARARARPDAGRRRRCSSTGPRSRRGSSARTGCGGCTASSATSTGAIAFVGGINIIDDVNTPRPEAAARRFRGARRGPAAASRSCARCSASGRSTSWSSSSAARCRCFPTPRRAPRAGAQTAKFVIRDNLRHRRDIERAYLAAIRTAKREILIANSYFFPGHPLPPRADRGGAARRRGDAAAAGARRVRAAALRVARAVRPAAGGRHRDPGVPPVVPAREGRGRSTTAGRPSARRTSIRTAC